jgi:hypothetical protein
MSARNPVTEVDKRFSSEGATPVPWEDARQQLEAAEIFWLSTVRPDGRPHVTPLIAVWLDNTLHFCTGEDERKRKNLAANNRCILTTGCNLYREGLDIVVEGWAERITEDDRLQGIAEAKYGADWRFDVRDGVFVSEGHEAWVYRVAPETAFGYLRGDKGSQTRWRF